MLKNEFERFYKDNYSSFIYQKARWMLGRYGKSFSDTDELISSTIELVYNNLNKLEESGLKSYIFITMQNNMRNIYLNSQYSKKICCCGDLSMSDWGVSEDNSLIIVDQSKLIDKKDEERVFKSKELAIFEDYQKLLPHEQKIINIYSELTVRLDLESKKEINIKKTAKKLEISDQKVIWIIKKFRTGAFKQKGFQNNTKPCTICGDKHFAKGYCVKHYMRSKRGKL